MNNKTSITYFILIIVLFFFGCRGPVNKENKNITTAGSGSLGQKYDIDIDESTVTWKGSMSIGPNSHQGYVSISAGELMIENGQVVGVTAEIDMNTIEDQNHQSDNNLIKHLKDPDFFDVEKFPIANFAFTTPPSISYEIQYTDGTTSGSIPGGTVTLPAYKVSWINVGWDAVNMDAVVDPLKTVNLYSVTIGTKSVHYHLDDHDLNDDEYIIYDNGSGGCEVLRCSGRHSADVEVSKYIFKYAIARVAIIVMVSHHLMVSPPLSHISMRQDTTAKNISIISANS